MKERGKFTGRAGLTGTRIRQRRLDLGIRQSELAEKCGISPAYLNLIEHNKRRIGGRLLLDIARALGIDPALLGSEPDASLMEFLALAAQQHGGAVRGDVEGAHDLMARFPGWALVISRQQQRIEALERMVEALGDRLSNDPQLSGILHGMITSAAAIRATAAILAEADGADGGLDPAWRARFQRNLDEDAGTLATRARALADYLEEAANIQREPLSHLDQLERFLAAHGWHFPALEGPGGAAPGPGGENLIESLLDTAPDWLAAPARAKARTWLGVIAQDARALPARPFLEAARELHFDPAALAARFGCETGRVMRRLAFVPWDQAPAGSGKAGATPGRAAGAEAGQGSGASPFGLVICDGGGGMLLQKPVPAFARPGIVSACPRWPLYLAFSRPAQILAREVAFHGNEAMRFRICAIAEPLAPGAVGEDPLLRGTMLIIPPQAAGALAGRAHEAAEPVEVGPGCRICPIEGCPARREPQLLA